MCENTLTGINRLAASGRTGITDKVVHIIEGLRNDAKSGMNDSSLFRINVTEAKSRMLGFDMAKALTCIEKGCTHGTRITRSCGT